MSDDTICIDVTFKTITCCYRDCGVTFALLSEWMQERREDHTWWYCPNGHRQHFPQQTKAERLAASLAATERRVEQEARDRVSAEYRLRAQKGVTTRIKNRVARGVCPCFNRTFGDLARHMTTKHPDYASPDPEDA